MSYLYFDRVSTSNIAINGAFTVVAAPASAPQAIFAIDCTSTALWSFSTDGGTTQVDIPANTFYRINIKDPYSKITFKNSAAIQVANYGQSAG